MADKANNDSKTEELLKQAQLLKSQAQRAETSASAAKDSGNDSSLGQLMNEVSTFNRTMSGIRGGYTKTKNAGKSFYGKFIQPVVHIGAKIVSPVYNSYKWLMTKTDHKSYENKWAKRGAKIGRAVLIAATLGIGINMIPASVGGNAVRYVTTEPLYDAARMAFFYKDKETAYLNHVQLVDHKNSEYVVGGSTKLDNRDTADSANYIVKPRLMNTLWSVWHGRPMFMPDAVVSPIASGSLNKCEITSYGARWRVAKMLQAYPFMLEAKCTTTDSFNLNATAAKEAAVQQQAPAAVKQNTTSPTLQSVMKSIFN